MSKNINIIIHFNASRWVLRKTPTLKFLFLILHSYDVFIQDYWVTQIYMRQFNIKVKCIPIFVLLCGKLSHHSQACGGSVSHLLHCIEILPAHWNFIPVVVTPHQIELIPNYRRLLPAKAVSVFGNLMRFEFPKNKILECVINRMMDRSRAWENKVHTHCGIIDPQL